MKDPLDLRSVSHEEAARKLYRWICRVAEDEGLDPEVEVMLQDPVTCEEYIDASGWRVCWESGPEKWAVALSQGKSLYWIETENEMWEPEVLLNGEHYWVEPYYGFDLVFYPPDE